MFKEIDYPDVVIPKPPGYKTVRQWEKEGRMPVSKEAVKIFAAVSPTGEIMRKDKSLPCTPDNVYFYKYVSAEDTMPFIRYATLDDLPKLAGKSIICFDTETTGLSKWDEILQITMSNRSGELLSAYVKPVRRKTWDKAAEVNGIYPEDVKDFPTASVLAPRIRAIIQAADVIVGHNVGFDIRMVEQCMHASFKGKIVADTLDLFREDCPKGKHKLVNAVEHYCPEFLEEFKAGAHKADMDVRATLKVFDAMTKQRERISEQHYACTPPSEEAEQDGIEFV